MGIEWLNSIQDVLKGLGIRTEEGSPGRRAMDIGQTVAAVNLTGLDAREGVMRATVTVITPRSAGAGACQRAAVEITGALEAAGGKWAFDGWRYDSAIDCCCIDVKGTRSVALGEDGWVGVEGYEVWIGETVQTFVTDFQAVKQTERRLYGGVCQSMPYGLTPGRGGWTVRLTQRIPWDQPEPASPEEPFSLTVTRGNHTQVFRGCGWSKYTSRQTDTGTELIRVGLAVEREVVENGSDQA